MPNFGAKLEQALNLLADSRLLDEAKHKFSSTQFDIEGELAERLRRYAAAIPDADLAEDGREDHFHVTVKYGLETDDVEEVREVLEGFGPFTVRLGKVSRFEADEHDVLKVDVEDDADPYVEAPLHDLNGYVAERIKCTDTHPTYQPHLTIAYLKKGKAEPYLGDDEFEGEEIKVTHVTFSDRDRNQTEFDLAAE